jgi:hypothetical protein
MTDFLMRLLRLCGEFHGICGLSLALKGGVSCRRYLIYEVRSARKLFNYGVCWRSGDQVL